MLSLKILVLESLKNTLDKLKCHSTIPPGQYFTCP